MTVILPAYARRRAFGERAGRYRQLRSLYERGAVALEWIFERTPFTAADACDAQVVIREIGIESLREYGSRIAQDRGRRLELVRGG
jgi:hypothetical protein